MQAGKNDIILLLAVSTILILLLSILVIVLVQAYQKKQILHHQNMAALKLDHEKHLMATCLEIQEDTFQQISREIHDNIGLSLSLVKLILNTLEEKSAENKSQQVKSAIELLGDAIVNLNGISKSLNADVIASYGFLKALEIEIQRIQKTGAFEIDLIIEGEPLYLETQKELVVFRIIQEALNNAIKHAKASHVLIVVRYEEKSISVSFSDNGIGFTIDKPDANLMGRAGLKNMETRARMLSGSMDVQAICGEGSLLNFYIPT